MENDTARVDNWLHGVTEFAKAPAIVKRIICGNAAHVFCEDFDGRFWVIPARNETPCRQVVLIDNCECPKCSPLC